MPENPFDISKLSNFTITEQSGGWVHLKPHEPEKFWEVNICCELLNRPPALYLLISKTTSIIYPDNKLSEELDPRIKDMNLTCYEFLHDPSSPHHYREGHHLLQFGNDQILDLTKTCVAEEKYTRNSPYNANVTFCKVNFRLSGKISKYSQYPWENTLPEVKIYPSHVPRVYSAFFEYDSFERFLESQRNNFEYVT